ncbi:hypothetical protein [Pediococcus pentosaceus]|uniref:hypothetical protein n=1 Tax=Pediococcus pentosaceus TaxID=1255 RepID=UPI0034E4A201
MLQTTQSISLNGSSVIDGASVVNFSTSLSADQAYSSVSMQIIDMELYKANKDKVREDRDAFQKQADTLADGLSTSEVK